jgi:hypothetical protein
MQIGQAGLRYTAQTKQARLAVYCPKSAAPAMRHQRKTGQAPLAARPAWSK